MRIAPVTSRREGFSLVEVLTALTIFLFSLVAFGQLLTVCSNMAHDTQYTNRALQLLESKLNEVTQGVLPLQAQGDTPFDEEPDWTFSITADADGAIPNLYHVSVTVSRKLTNGNSFERSVSQIVFDPNSKGTLSSSSTSGSSSSGTTGTGTGSN